MIIARKLRDGVWRSEAVGQEAPISFCIYLSPGSDCPSRSMPKASISSMNITAGDLAFHRYTDTSISNFLRRQEFALSNNR